MPDLPLYGSTPLAGGSLPVRSRLDVLALLPPEVRNSASAPVRDALTAALTAILQEYQRRSSRGAALADILRATGTHLEGLARDHDVFKQPGESDEALRARVLSLADLVTPDAIVEAVNAILEPHTPLRCRYFESELDQWFVTDGMAAFDSFVFNGSAAASPYYPDRLYPDDSATNGGVSLPNREALGAWVFSDSVGRHFLLRIPPLEAVDDDGSYCLDAAVTSAEDAMMFIADGSDTSGAESDGTVTSFIYTDQVLSDELYAAIVSVVELLKGQGIRWSAHVDPLLT
jgi:hypothetical protein